MCVSASASEYLYLCRTLNLHFHPALLAVSPTQCTLLSILKLISLELYINTLQPRPISPTWWSCKTKLLFSLPLLFIFSSVFLSIHCLFALFVISPLPFSSLPSSIFCLLFPPPSLWSFMGCGGEQKTSLMYSNTSCHGWCARRHPFCEAVVFT